LFGATQYYGREKVEQQQKRQELIKAWTPEVRDNFIEMGKQAGCFGSNMKAIYYPDGRYKESCYNSSSYFDKEKNQWVTECEAMCIQEIPECYADGWNPPKSKRCKNLDEYYANPEEWRRKNK
jgi:hypothetical protein